MKKNIVSIHPRLNHFLAIWAYWECHLLEGLGNFISSIALINADISPDFKNKVYGPKTPYINEIANYLNFIITHHLAKEKPKQADALFIHYIAPKSKFSQLLKERKINRRALNYRLENAKKWLSQWIEKDSFFQNLEKE